MHLLSMIALAAAKTAKGMPGKLTARCTALQCMSAGAI